MTFAVKLIERHVVFTGLRTISSIVVISKLSIVVVLVGQRDAACGTLRGAVALTKKLSTLHLSVRSGVLTATPVGKTSVVE